MSLEIFLKECRAAFKENTLRRLTLSRPLSGELRKTVSFRQIEIGRERRFQILHRFPTRDEVENREGKDCHPLIEEMLGKQFGDAHLELEEAVLTIRFSRKGSPSFSRKKIPSASAKLLQHDRKKHGLLDAAELPWLVDLGLANTQGQIFPRSSSKWNQVQRFVELLDHAARDMQWSAETELQVHDMGCGKGYLTFAIETWLTEIRHQPAMVIGVEQREELVDFCNATTEKYGRNNLRFEKGRIEDFSGNLDVLIALHACNTATDDALALGIKNKSQLIVCAPCCQHELRGKIKGTSSTTGLLEHGLIRQRQAALLTDSLRALVLEREGYHVRVVDFVSSEHTDKNLLLIASKMSKRSGGVQEKINALKILFGIESFYLESLLP